MKVPAFITKFRERRAQRRWEFEKPLRLQQADKAKDPIKGFEGGVLGGSLDGGGGGDFGGGGDG